MRERAFLTLCLVLSMVTHLLGQAPPGFSYQAVVRNSNNSLVVNSQVGLRVSILQGSETGALQYSEEITTRTNENGLVNVQIGNADQGSLSEVDWGNGPHFVKLEIDPTGGVNYSISGTQQLLSVPFALYANDSGSGLPNVSEGQGQMLYWNGANWQLIPPGKDGQLLTFCKGIPQWGPCTYSIGDRGPAGGYVFYDKGFYSDGWRFMEVADTEQRSLANWGCSGTLVVGADGTAVGTGEQNTLDIVAVCTDPNSAANICNNLVLNDFDDWFLPSPDELALVFSNIVQGRGIPGFTNNYWTSKQGSSASTAFFYSHTALQTFEGNREAGVQAGVRAVRAF